MFSLIARDIRLMLSRGSEGLTAVAFFIVVISMFPFSFGGNDHVLRLAAPGIIWVACLLSALLSLEGVYHRDFEDGTFDLMLLSPVPVVDIVFAKMCAHWIVSGLTLLLASVVGSQMLLLSVDVLPVLLLSLFLGTLYMSLLGAAGAILTFGAKRPGLLLVLLVLPFMIPMLIFGIMALEANVAGLNAKPYILLQIAMVVVALPLAPLMSVQLLKMNLRSV